MEELGIGTEDTSGWRALLAYTSIGGTGNRDLGLLSFLLKVQGGPKGSASIDRRGEQCGGLFIMPSRFIES